MKSVFPFPLAFGLLLFPLFSFGADFQSQKSTQFCLWSNDGNDGALTISMDGNVVGELTEHFTYPKKPEFGQDGTIVVSTTPGTHTFHVDSDGGLSWDGSATIAEGQQLLWQFIVTQVCFWTDQGDEGTISIQIDGEPVGQLTQHFSYDSPDSHPRFGQDGTLVVTVTEGTHTFYAHSEGNEYWGPYTFTVEQGEQQINALRK